MSRVSGRDPLRKFPVEVRSALLMAQGHECQHCGVRLTDGNWRGDHIDPHSQGGRTEFANVQILCRRCSAEKSYRATHKEIERDLEEAEARWLQIIELLASGGNPPGVGGVLGGDWAPPGAKHHVTRWNFDLELRGGIPAPKLGGLCHRAWQIMDTLTVAGVPPSSWTDCADAAEAQDLNGDNMRAEYPRWKSFNGFAPAKPLPPEFRY